MCPAGVSLVWEFEETCGPPIAHKTFISDAAGLSIDGVFSFRPGVASVGFSESGKILMAFRLPWPKKMIMTECDSKGVRFGDKSTCLEMVGLLLPFLLVPVSLRNQHVVLIVDNIACVYSRDSKSLNEDSSASVILRAIHLISSYLGTTVHVRHIPRNSNWESSMVDRMSRGKTLSTWDISLLKSFPGLSIPPALIEWVEHPSEDWGLPLRLLNYVRTICDSR